jgi:transcriptional regulator with XRE-family HTH domain
MKPVYITKRHIDHERTGKLIRAARVRRKLSIATVAAASGMSSPYLSYLERGDRAWSEETFELVRSVIEGD